MAKSGIYFPYSSIISTRSYLKKNRPAALAFVKAYSDGVKRMASDKPFALSVLRKYMRENDPEILDVTYRYAVDYIVRVPELNREGIAEVIRQSPDPKAKSAMPEDFIDDSVLRELQQRGQYR
jgi:hypothetical protein